MNGSDSRATPSYPNPANVRAALQGPFADLLRQLAQLPVSGGK